MSRNKLPKNVPFIRHLSFFIMLYNSVHRCALTKRWFLPSNLRALVKSTVRAGMLMPMAKVSVANRA